MLAKNIKKSGRPSLGDAARQQVPVRLNAEEHAMFMAAAKLEGLPTSTWLRRAGLATARSTLQSKKI